MERYELERSFNGTVFSRISTTIAVGNSPVEVNYNCIDANPQTGNNFYRVKAIDKVGTVKYSDIVKIKRNSIGFDAFVSPNPAPAGNIQLTINSSVLQNITITIFNAAGQQVYSEQQKISAGTNRRTLSVKSLAAGTYILSVQDGEKEIRKSFVIK